MEKEKNSNRNTDGACSVLTELTQMLNEGASYYTQQQRLLSDCILNILLTSRYMTASRLDFALQGENKHISRV